MPLPPLTAMFQSPDVSIPADAAVGAVGADAGARPFIDQGTVLAVYDSGVMTVRQADGTVVDATQATDEPILAGQTVWISPTTTTPVVHGSA